MPEEHLSEHTCIECLGTLIIVRFLLTIYRKKNAFKHYIFRKKQMFILQTTAQIIITSIEC